MPFCTQCGSSLPGGARFCTGCGTALAGSPQTAQKSPTSPTVQRSGGSPQTAVRSSPQPAKKWGSPTSSGSGPTYNAGGITRSTPQVKSITTGNAGPSNTSYAAGLDNSYNSGLHKSDYKVTYEKQPSWAFAEQHKNTHGQYQHGQFRHVNL